MKSIFTVAIMAVVCLLSAQNEVLDTKISNNQLIVTVEVEPGYTAYTLAKAFGTTVEHILRLSNKTNSALNIGDQLRIPLDKSLLSTAFRDVQRPRAINITTTKGDNLFRLSKVSGISSEQILALNGKTSEELGTGETILLGWIAWPYGDDSSAFANEPILDQSDALPVQLKIHVPDLPSASYSNIISSLDHQSSLKMDHVTVDLNAPYEDVIVDLDDDEELEEKKEEIKKEKGIAYWEKSNYAQSDLIVMHPTAKVNSKISLYNPMLKRKVEAQVVGEMPEESYAEDVSVVISPSVASALGALDRRFLVEITYVE